MATNHNEKLDALFTVARAFLARGAAIQYDELSMDRIQKVTPRRELHAVPERATKQNILFLDCSSFVFSCYYQAFGYALGADLTRDMVNLSNIRVFDYHIKGDETDQEKFQQMEKFKSILLPGDLLVSVREDNGHTMLYMGEGEFYHCTSGGRPGSYDYQKLRNNFYGDGALTSLKLEDILTSELDGAPNRSYLFKEDNVRFCLLRPLLEIEGITPDSKKRMQGLRDIYVAVTPSLAEGRSLREGERLDYRVDLKNFGTCEASLELAFNGQTEVFALQPEESMFRVFHVDNDFTLSGTNYLLRPTVSVNGLDIYAPAVLAEGKNNASDFNLPNAFDLVKELFIPESSLDGLVYRLNYDSKFISALVPGFYGGYGTITPDIVNNPELRIKYISLDSFQEGDYVLYKKSEVAKSQYAKYLGDGSFLYSENITGEIFVDRLFGYYCFCLLRPSLFRR